MTAPDRSSEVAAWVNDNRRLFQGAGANADDRRRELLIPLARHLNAIEGRNVWGRLVKRDRSPEFVPHDILVWKDTREHYDVFTGTDRVEDTQPSWGFNPPPDNPRWEWQDAQGGGGITQPEPPAVLPPAVQPPADSELKARVVSLEALTAKQDKLIREHIDRANSLADRITTLEQRLDEHESRPAPAFTLPPLVVRGTTGRVVGHAHPVELRVEIDR
jgi:hypothetical protein